jgi:hypothetical protein
MNHMELLSTLALLGLRIRYWVVIIIIVVVVFALIFYARGRS